MLDQMCRTCLATSGELVSIFSNDYYVHDLPDKLLHTISIEVDEHDELPKMMCKKCIFLVDSLYCFKDQCEMAEIKLKTKLKNDFKSPTNTSNYNNINYVSTKENDHSDVSSSEDDFQVEYVSEEARLEVEKAKRRSKIAKRNHNKTRINMKSKETLPDETNDNTYKNKIPNYTFEISEIEEDKNITDSDDRSSIYSSSETSRLKENKEKKTHLVKNTNLESSQEKSGLKRKIHSHGSSIQTSKAPKKVIYMTEDLAENMPYVQPTSIEKGDVKSKDHFTSQLGLVENNKKKIKSSSRNLNNFSSNSDIPAVPTFTEKLLELRMQNVIKHVILHIPEICAICTKTFDTYADVLKHKIEVHLSADEEYFFCPICDEKFFANGDLVEHLNEHVNVKSFICILCSTNLFTEESLRLHLLTHMNLSDLRCLMCNKKLPRVQALSKHFEQHINAKELVCMFCSDNFPTKIALELHFKRKHITPRNMEVKICSQSNEEISTESSSSYPCPYCEHIFNQKDDLRDHVFTHLGNQQYTCLVCEKVFNSQEERTRHMQEHVKPPRKEDNKKFRCRVCHDILLSRNAYGEHLKEKHWNSKQTSEILKELSDSINERVQNQSNSGAHADETLSLT